MAIVAGTKFITYNPNLDLQERRSTGPNDKTRVYTIEDIVGEAAGANLASTDQTLTDATRKIILKGPLATDILSVRNSADTSDLFTVLGDGQVYSNASGVSNSTSYGSSSGLSNTGPSQSAFGYSAGKLNTGESQTVTGRNAGYSNTGDYQTASGLSSGNSNTGGYQSAFGYQSGTSNTGTNQSAFGAYAGFYNTGDDNCNFGYSAGRYITGGATLNTTSSNSIYLGANTLSSAVTTTNEIVIGDSALGNGSNSTTIGNASTVLSVLRGTLNVPDLPTSAVGLNTGDVWNNSGVLNIV